MSPAGRQRIVLGILLLPSVILTVFFLAVPLFIIVLYSFFERDDYGAVVEKLTLSNYVHLLDPVYLGILLNSLQLALINTVICLFLGYAVAYYIAFRAGSWAPTLLTLLLIPFWVNFLIRISAWIVLLGRGGLLNAAALGTGLTSHPIGMLGTYGAVFAGLVYAFLPSAVLPIYAALQPLDRRLHEAAQDLGASPLQGFLRVTLPLSMPGVMAAALFVFVPSMGVFAIPVLLGGGKSIIIGNLIVQLFLEFRSIPLGSAVATVLLVLSIAGVYGYMQGLRRFERAFA